MRRLLALLTVLVLALTACGSGDGGETDAETGIPGLEVTGAFGKAPTITTGTDFSVDETESKVLSEGDGATIAEGDAITLNFTAVNGRTGKEFGTSFGDQGQPLSTELTSAALVPGFVKGLEGTTVGSRVAVAIPPADGFPDGNPQIGLEKGDTMVWVFDVVDKIQPQDATGTIDDVTVTGEQGEAPTVEVKDEFYVDETASKVLVEGDGEKVAAGDSISVNYVGINGRDGSTFDSSFERGQPADFELTEGMLVPGFLEGLIGKNVGDRVLIVIPSDQGYGVQGNPQAKIEANDTLVFVVDILKINS